MNCCPPTNSSTLGGAVRINPPRSQSFFAVLGSNSDNVGPGSPSYQSPWSDTLAHKMNPTSALALTPAAWHFRSRLREFIPAILARSLTELIARGLQKPSLTTSMMVMTVRHGEASLRIDGRTPRNYQRRQWWGCSAIQSSPRHRSHTPLTSAISSQHIGSSAPAPSRLLKNQG